MVVRYVALLAVALAGGCSGASESDGDEVAAAGTTLAFVSTPTALPNGTQYTAVVAQGARPEQLTAAAQAFCGEKDWCQVMAWQDPAHVPRQMPMLDREANSVAFSYLMNRSSGAEQVMWNCKVWPGEPGNCLAGE